jgi:aminoglycoside phosphotransferase (APT) family kinase protein
MLIVARAGGLPIPKPLWLETDPTILGGAFIAMDRVKGYCLGTSIGAREGVPDSHLKSLAATLAKLHSLQWREASPALPEARGFSRGEITAASALAGLLDRWRHYRQIATNDAPSPILDAATDWLNINAPTSLSDPCITHGDVGFHNIMGDEQGFTALLDWETACLASPAKDLAHVRPAVLPHVDWSLFLQWYRDAGGAQVPAAEIKWFEVFRAFSMTLVCQVAIAKLRQPATARLEYLQLGYLVQPVMFDQLRELIED